MSQVSIVKSIPILLVALICCPRLLASQGERILTPYGVPTGPIACRIHSGAGRDSALVGYEFVDRIATTTRVSAIAYDTSGHPMAAVFILTADDSSMIDDKIVIRVDLAGSTGGLRFAARNGGIDSLLPRQKSRSGQLLPVGATELREDDVRQLRVLAEWLWKHRCEAQ